jgi:RNA polymerase sigma factor (sigma-70 family)
MYILDESQIIQGCKSGDRRCQEALVHKFAPRLLAVCKRYCSDASLAEDALQETFINIFKYISTYSGSGSFEGWLRRIAVTKSIEINKKFFKVNLFPIEAEINHADVVIPDVFSTLGEKDIQLLLEQLPKNQYVVFNLFVVEGYSHQEIGEILSVAEGSSRALLSRARSSLISMMENQYQYNRYPLAHL